MNSGFTDSFYVEGDEVEVKPFDCQRGVVTTVGWNDSLRTNSYGIDLEDGTYVTDLISDDLVLLKSSPHYMEPKPKALPWQTGLHDYFDGPQDGGYSSEQGSGQWYRPYSDKAKGGVPNAEAKKPPFISHKHLRESFTVPLMGKVYLSSYHTDEMANKGTEPIPDVRVLLDHHRLPKGWMGGAGTDITVDGASAIAVIWPDFGAIPVAHLDFVVDHIMDLVRDGKIVEIGCHGGHGRTGSLVAGLLIKASSFTAKGAMSRVRGAYCSRAIESKTQETMLEEYATFLRNEIEG